MAKVSTSYDVSHVRLHEGMIDLMKEDSIQQLISQVESTPGADMWGSIPCTPWTTWQHMAIHRYGQSYAKRLEQRRLSSRKM